MMTKLFNFLEYLTDSDHKFANFIYNLLAPISLFLEYICYWYFWKKIIITEILTSDNIVEFLDKNEFGYTGDKLWKSDLISSNEYFDRLSLEDSKNSIKKEYIEALDKIFSENLSINVEDYITLIVSSEVKFIKHQGEGFRDRIYTVTLQFCRLYYIQKLKNKTLIWFIINLLLIGIGYLLFINHLIIFK